MKKIIKLLILTFAFTSVYSQESRTYKIKRSEMYIYNTFLKEWEQQSVNEDVSINLVTYKNVINIQAKTPSLYRLDEDSKERMETPSLKGYKYRAIECVDMKNCLVDVLVSKEDENRVFVFSAVFDNEVLGKVNLRFFGYLE